MPTVGMPRVWVVDDDRGVCSAVARLLRTAALQVETMGSGAELLTRLERDEPDCLVLDLRLPEINGLGLLEVAKQHGCQIPVVFLSGDADVRSCVEAMKQGAVDFLEKPVEAGPLLDAVIRAIARGLAAREAREATEAATLRLASLTRREREVFGLVTLGKPNKRIAFELGTTEKTIKVHRGRVMQKLGASSVVDLVRLAERAGQARG